MNFIVFADLTMQTIRSYSKNRLKHLTKLLTRNDRNCLSKRFCGEIYNNDKKYGADRLTAILPQDETQAYRQKMILPSLRTAIVQFLGSRKMTFRAASRFISSLIAA